MPKCPECDGALELSADVIAHESIEVMACLRNGKLESDIMPLDESLAIMRTMDTLREPWGLKYPADNEIGA